MTGVDFSKRSIDYAKNSALKNGLNITYHYQDYLSLKLNTMYDFATMIYFDYGALSTFERQTLLRNVYQHLRCGGKLLLDVFSMAKYNNFEEKQTWKNCENGGFWREDGYLELNRYCKYSDHVTLEQTSIISNEGVDNYYLWNTCFTKEMLTKETKQAGFNVREVFSDVAGEVYSKDNFTIAILLEK